MGAFLDTTKPQSNAALARPHDPDPPRRSRSAGLISSLRRGRRRCPGEQQCPRSIYPPEDLPHSCGDREISQGKSPVARMRRRPAVKRAQMRWTKIFHMTIECQ